ncbi:MAG TPA: hypothetical protein VFF62_14585 [Candidatus Nitrosocosmicus sp.]|jgi:hypothetical protein|nr:hypothetical protein [Candidatus Nitrosocosmicus sp.]
MKAEARLRIRKKKLDVQINRVKREVKTLKKRLAKRLRILSRRLAIKKKLK